jgi:Fic family protein
LYTETDDNDLTYFLLHQTDTIHRGILALHVLFERKQLEMKDAEIRLTAFPNLNHSQLSIIEHALRHPGQEISFKGYKELYRVAYATARSDLLGIKEIGLFEQRNRGKAMIFTPTPDIESRLKT